MSFLCRNLITLQSAELTARKRFGTHFRKTLGVYNYKVKPANYYKNPHAVPLATNEYFKSRGDNGKRLAKTYQRNSLRPFGKLSKKGRFFHIHYQQPNFKLFLPKDRQFKPYVQYMAPLIPEEEREKKRTEIDEEYLLKKIKPQLESSHTRAVRDMADEIFNTTKGKLIIKEFFNKPKDRMI